MRYQVYNIKWDVTDESTDEVEEFNLPSSMIVDVEDEEEIADKISDMSGFCHFGFEYETME